MSSARTSASLVSCCALVIILGFSQTGCVPKQAAPVPEEVTESDSVELDLALAISRELYLAASSPGTLVGSDSLTVSELEEHRAVYGNDLELTDDRIMIEDALDDLSPREREVIELRFKEGLTQIEMAERLGISQVQVSRLLRRTLKKIQDKIDPSGSLVRS